MEWSLYIPVFYTSLSNPGVRDITRFDSTFFKFTLIKNTTVWEYSSGARAIGATFTCVNMTHKKAL